MLTREQVYTMLRLRLRDQSHPFFLPEYDLIKLIRDRSDADSIFSIEINTALRHAALGEQKDIEKAVEMVKANPRLLLEAGNVVTRGGTKIIRTTLYEFFLGSGYPEGAKLIEPYFAKILDEDGNSIGEVERVRQCERYRPHIKKLAQDVRLYQETGQSAYDLRPLIDLIIRSSQANITAELQQTEGHNSELRDRMCAFRDAINESQQSRTVGMHYAHYTTILQVLDLLHERWEALSHNNTNHDKCSLVFSQIFGYLELVGLPARERFAFARAFADEQLSVRCKYSLSKEFPDFDFSNLVRTGLGFSLGIIGRFQLELTDCAGHGFSRFPSSRALNHMLNKNLMLSGLMRMPQPGETALSSRCVLL